LSNNYTSQARNKLIAKAFKEVGLIERYGSGIRRILNICEEYGIIQPKIEEVFNGFRILLYKEKLIHTDVTDNVVEKVIEKVIEKVVDKLSNNQKHILLLMSQNQYISSRELALKVGISQRKIQENIRKLIKMMILTRVGAAKGGYWEIINDTKK
jgi:ATP-dependent DNA helicase RecG